ncbi:hypothetical protein [Nonomuraea lactucae]|uniref:hypothetical protein n=1 Tax=Nonomuraea lactucae TaxID=2249762 RepID=UPI0013B3E083|nr:hypothetical protein [Nonomuraea lactucae]
MIELDGEPHQRPGRLRRWPIHWDDLLVYTIQAGPDEQACSYRLGLSGVKRNAVQHAVPADRQTSLCDEPVQPLPTLDWSLPFLPTATRACPACVRLIYQSIDEAAARVAYRRHQVR